MSTFKLVSFDLCPFVQRSAITLLEKDIPFERNDIDLNDKPDWFLKISPFGKVPVLQVEGKSIYESAVINEYLNEVTPGDLHPSDPLEKAIHRSWIEYASVLLVNGYKVHVARSAEDAQKPLENIQEALQRLEGTIEGPYFSGDSFALVDTAFAPGLQRLHWTDQIHPDLKIFAATPKVKAWTETLLQRPSVQASLAPNIEARFRSYLQGQLSASKTVEPFWLAQFL